MGQRGLQGHQRRDFLELGNAHPTLLAWAMTWLDTIAQLYRLNDLRLAQPMGSPLYAVHDIAERAHRTPVVGRKNFFGSGSLCSGQLAAAMYTLLMTVKLHRIILRTWLLAYLQACCETGNRASLDIRAFLPWAMRAPELAGMRAHPITTDPTIEGVDTSSPCFYEDLRMTVCCVRDFSPADSQTIRS